MIAGAVVTVGVAILLATTLLKVLPTRNSRAMRAILTEMAFKKQKLKLSLDVVYMNQVASPLFISIPCRKAPRKSKWLQNDDPCCLRFDVQHLVPSRKEGIFGPGKQYSRPNN